MYKFSMKADLAAGLSWRLEKLDAQMVVDAVEGDPEHAIRSNLRIVKHIEEANKKFMSATKETMEKKQKIYKELEEKFRQDSKDLKDEEKAKMGKTLSEEFAKRAAEIQKGSKAEPDEMVEILLSDSDYEMVLKPVFKKTVATWDSDGSGSGQRIFLEVADAISAAVQS